MYFPNLKIFVKGTKNTFSKVSLKMRDLCSTTSVDEPRLFQLSNQINYLPTKSSVHVSSFSKKFINHCIYTFDSLSNFFAKSIWQSAKFFSFFTYIHHYEL